MHDSSAVLAVLCPWLFTRARRLAAHVECQGKHTRGVCVADMRVEAHDSLTYEECLSLDAGMSR